MADLAGVPVNDTAKYNWDGSSFKNLLLVDSSSNSSSSSSTNSSNGSSPAVVTDAADDAAASAGLTAVRGWSLASDKQQERMIFHLSVGCWDADTVPALGPDRWGPRVTCYNMAQNTTYDITL
jgi:hypothetical protein